MGNTENEEVMTTQEAADFLKLSLCTMYKLQRLGLVPYKKIGAQARFCKSELIEWLKNGDSVEA